MTDFFVIIPTFNAAPYLDRLFASLVYQFGEFKLEVHVQDCESTDGTKEIVQRWQLMLENRLLSESCVKISITSAPDGGLYDAVARAAEKISDENCIMTWIGSDDVFMPGALATAASIFKQHQEVMWLTGAPHVANEKGEVFTPWPPVRFSRYHLYSGHYDGRGKGDSSTQALVMQEGTFWRFRLWQKVGGIDKTFKLAGDWDLWRRFAEHAELYCVNFPMACFSRRLGQKSSDIDGYHAEIDKIGYRKPPFANIVSYTLTRYPWTTDWTVEAIDVHSRFNFARMKRVLESIRAFLCSRFRWLR